MTPDQLRQLLTRVAVQAARVGSLPDEAEAGPPAGHLFRPVDPRQAGVVADWSSPVAIRWAPELDLEPRELADVLAAGLIDSEDVEAVEVAPTGWLAITLDDAARSRVVPLVLGDPDGYAVPEGLPLRPVHDERPGSRPSDDPVARIQLAHARQCRRVRNATAVGVECRPSDRLEGLTHVSERALLVALADLPQRLARHRSDPAQLERAMTDLAERADAWTHPVRPLVVAAPIESIHGARLALAAATRHVLRNGLRVLGASAPERM